MPDNSPAAVFDRLLHGVCEQRWDDLPGLYALQTNVVHPMDPGRPPPLRTRAELETHFQHGAQALGEIRFTPAQVRVHQTSDPEVIVAEFEYRGVIPATGGPFAIPSVFVMRIRDGQIVESRDYGDHAEIARIFGAQAAGTSPAADWREQALRDYEAAVFAGDAAALEHGDHVLDAAAADLALARGRIGHARFLATGQPDEATLACFEQAAELYGQLGDQRGEAEAVFWIAVFHQVTRGDQEQAGPLLTRARELASAAGDQKTLSYVERHLGFAAQAAGRLDEAGQHFRESLRLRRDIGFEAGVAAGLLALADLALARGDAGQAQALRTEAAQAAKASGASAILARIEAETPAG
jgi:ketosteroid isomerase-like protein